jgi:hypothetical protein
MTLICCEACKAPIDANNTKGVSRVRVGRKDLLFVECPRCSKLNKIELN